MLPKTLQIPCTCGAEKTGSPGHTDYCDISQWNRLEITERVPGAGDADESLLGALTQQDIDNLFKDLVQDVIKLEEQYGLPDINDFIHKEKN